LGCDNRRTTLATPILNSSDPSLWPTVRLGLVVSLVNDGLVLSHATQRLSYRERSRRAQSRVESGDHQVAVLGYGGGTE
jgi:hypothetical protein